MWIQAGAGRPVQGVGECEGPAQEGPVQAETHLTSVDLHQWETVIFGLHQDLDAVFTLW